MNEVDQRANAGRNHFAAGEFAEALIIFDECGATLKKSLLPAKSKKEHAPSKGFTALLTKLVNNAAACNLKLDDPAAALRNATEAASLDPCNDKALFRVAHACELLFEGGSQAQTTDSGRPVTLSGVALLHHAFKHVCLSVACTVGGRRDPRAGTVSAQVADLFARLRERLVRARDSESPENPESPDTDGVGPVVRPPALVDFVQRIGDIVCVHDGETLAEVVYEAPMPGFPVHGFRLIVLRPGQYTGVELWETRLRIGRDVCLVGLGGQASVRLHKADRHFVYVTDKIHVHLENVQIVGAKSRNPQQHCAVGCNSEAKRGKRAVSLKFCDIRDCPGGGVLATGKGSQVRLEDCSFTGMGMSIAEIRMDARFTATRVHAHDIAGGVNTCAGAGHVHLTDVVIERCTGEYALLVAGLGGRNGFQHEIVEQIQNNPELLRKNPELAVFVGGDEFVSAERFASLAVGQESERKARDAGSDGFVTLFARGCVFKGVKEKTVMCQNGGYARFSGCSFEDSANGVFLQGGSSAHFSNCRAMNCSETGIHVSANYDGDVTLEGCVFFKNRKLNFAEIKDLSADLQHTVWEQRMWSRPATVRDLRVVTKKEDVPTVEELVQADTRDERVARSVVAKMKQLREVAGAKAPDVKDCVFAPNRATLRVACEEFWYPIGNTKGFDLLAGDAGAEASAAASAEECAEQRVLLAACGDIRNLVATVCCWWERKQKNAAHEGRLRIVLNDANVSILARNALLLHMVHSNEDPAMPACVGEVWGSLGLQPKHATKLRVALEELAAEGAELSEGTALAGFLGAEPRASLLKRLRAVFRAWLDCPLTLADVKELRDASEIGSVFMRKAAVDLARNAVSFQSPREAAAPSTSQRAKKGKKAKKETDATSSVSQDDVKRIEMYMDSGCYSNKCSKPNPTLLEGPHLQYNMYWSSAIYRMTGCVDVQSFFRTHLPALREALCSGLVEVGLDQGDLFQIDCGTSSIAAGGGRFDAADFTNVADYVGLANVLACGARLVRSGGHVFLEQFKWTAALEGTAIKNMDFAQAADAFVRGSLGVRNLQDFTALSGLELADKWEDVSTFAAWRKTQKTCVLRTRWRKCCAADERSKLTASKLIVIARKTFCRLGRGKRIFFYWRELQVSRCTSMICNKTMLQQAEFRAQFFLQTPLRCRGSSWRRWG